MAQSNSKPIDLEIMERAWIKKALEDKVKALSRNRANEIPGTEIYDLRTREIQYVNTLIGKF